MNTLPRKFFQLDSNLWLRKHSFSSGQRSNQQQNETLESFDKMIDYHRSCARNSILIRSPNFLSTASLNGICQDPSLRLTEKTVACYHHTFGEQKTYFYYLCQVGRKRADYFTSNFPHSSSDGVPVRMRLLKLARESNDVYDLPHYRTVLSEQRFSLRNVAQRREKYCECVLRRDKSIFIRRYSTKFKIDDQMENLVNEMELKPAGIAMRFFVASLVEDIFCGLFPNSVCTPFGSSLNGFGKKGGDLDMHMEFEDPTLVRKRTLNRKLNVIYRSTGTTDDRQLNQKILDIYATVLSNFVPFCSDVRRILNARVPIIKFNIGFGGISCDLSANNTTGIEMAKILWVYSRLHKRIRPLIFTIRHWAKIVGLTHHIPGQWITNFQLTCLVLFFMQSRKPSKNNSQNERPLPPIDFLRARASPQDSFGIVSNPNNVDFDQQTTQASQLLLEFFAFYSNFCFDRYAICLDSGRFFDKPSSQSAHLCINNPVERHLIISKNVNLSEVQLFQDSCRRAKILLDDVINNGSSPPSSYVKKNSWGLLRLFELMAGYRNTKDLAGFYPNQAYPNDKNSSPSGKSIILNQILRGEFDELDKSIPKKIRQ